MPQLCFNLHPKWQRTISALLTCHAILSWANVTTSRRKGRPCSSLFGANWSHALSYMMFFRPFSSSDQVNELFESVCTQALCFWNKEQDLSPEAAPPSWYRKPFSLPFSSEKKLADHVWEHDVILAEQNSGILLRILSVQIKTSQDRALTFCITQSCPVPGAAMWYWSSNLI